VDFFKRAAKGPVN